MIAKKDPSKDVYSRSTLFFSIGLCASLLLAVAAFEWKFYDQGNLVDLKSDLGAFDEVLDIPITEQPPPPPPKVQPNIVLQEVTNEEVIEPLEVELDIEITEEQRIEEVVFQQEPEEEIVDEVFLIVEEMPEPLGGYTAFYKYLFDHFKYPEVAKRAGIEGRMVVQLIIAKDGSLEDVLILKGLGFGYDEEALRVVKAFGKWSPGKQRGNPVRVKINLPLKFELSD